MFLENSSEIDINHVIIHLYIFKQLILQNRRCITMNVLLISHYCRISKTESAQHWNERHVLQYFSNWTINHFKIAHVIYFNGHWLQKACEAQSGYSDLCLTRFYFRFHHRSNGAQALAVKRLILFNYHFNG